MGLLFAVEILASHMMNEEEIDENEVRAYAFAQKNRGASEIDLVSALHMNRLEAAYLIERMIERGVLSPEISNRRHPLAKGR